MQGTASGPLDNYTPDPEISQPAVTDPLSFMNLPPDMSTLSVQSNPCTDGPGKYGSVQLPQRLAAPSSRPLRHRRTLRDGMEARGQQ